MKKNTLLLTAMLCTAGIVVLFGCDASGTGGCGNQVVATTVTGPITGGNGVIFSYTQVDLDEYGYSEKEYFYEGQATAYEQQGEPTEDGKWTLTESTTAKFKTRMIVRRPIDASKFNGTVILEWLNVSGGVDADPGFMYNYQEILRKGYAWVGVSAQMQGVQGGGWSMGFAVKPLTKWDKKRYGSLYHPGDDYCYDIFTRAAQIVKGTANKSAIGTANVDVLEGLTPLRLIAYGESQSAGRMVSYVNGVHPLVKAFDGFFVHSSLGGARPFTTPESSGGCSGTDPMEGTVAVKIRDDLDEKVFHFETEGDVIGENGYHNIRQPNSDAYHRWEVAGTAHADKYILDLNMSHPEMENISGLLDCPNANTGPHHQVIKAALYALHEWIVNGTTPPVAELLEVDATGDPITDAHGNILGGVRSPLLDVPIATYKAQAIADDDHSTGCGSSLIDTVCGLFGETIPFSDEKLNELYESHDDYVQKVTAAAAEAREAGFLLAPEEQTFIEEAEAAQIPPKDF